MLLASTENDLNAYFLMDETFHVWFSAVFHNMDEPLLGDWSDPMFYITRAKQEISTLPLSEVEIVSY